MDGSKLRHYLHNYNEAKKLADGLKAEVVDLQERKEAVKEEHLQTKNAVPIEKLKGAATTAVTNVAENVGYLFGSNKVRIPKRENGRLHERVSELEEAQQREQ